MTNQSQLIILTSLREYKRENLARANGLRDVTMDMNTEWAEQQFEEHMRIDEAVEIALQEIAVAV